VKIGDETVRIDETRWTGFRDHSWGVRMDVGEMPRDVYVPNRLTSNFILQWSPMVFTRPDGSMYEIHPLPAGGRHVVTTSRASRTGTTAARSASTGCGTS